MITDAYRAAIKNVEGGNYEYINFALQPLGLIRDSFQKGKITVADIFQVLSLGIGLDGHAGYPLVAFYVSGKELKDVLEVHTTVALLLLCIFCLAVWFVVRRIRQVSNIK